MGQQIHRQAETVGMPKYLHIDRHSQTVESDEMEGRALPDG